MRVCLVSHGSGRGGAEEVLLETVDCLREHKIDCCVLMPGDDGLGEELKKLGVPFYSLPYWLWMGNRSMWRRTQMIARNLLLSVPAVVKLRKWKPDIIYSNTMTVCFGAILAAVLRRPHVWHLHELGYEDHGLRFDLGKRFSYRVINSASACIAASKAIAEAHGTHINARKLRTVYYSMHRFKAKGDRAGTVTVPPNAHKLRCVLVGKLSEGKRQKDAVEAMAELKCAGVDAELLVIGPSNPGYREGLEKLVEEHELADRISIIGSWQPVRNFVESADVILMCSRCEAFGRVTVEGMLAGKPVVAANTGANPELIEDGVNGFLYQMGDVKDLAEKIRYVNDHRDLASLLGRNAKSWAEAHFTKERYAAELIAILTSVAPRDQGILAQRRSTTRTANAQDTWRSEP